MARKRKKQTLNLFSALVIEALAVVVFFTIFIQARTERQIEAGIENRQVPMLSNMFEQTPFRDLVEQSQNESSFFEWN